MDWCAGVSFVCTQVMQTVRSYFPPEFMNRIDEVVLFNKLKREDMREIVLNQVWSIRQPLGGGRGGC